MYSELLSCMLTIYLGLPCVILADRLPAFPLFLPIFWTQFPVFPDSLRSLVAGFSVWISQVGFFCWRNHQMITAIDFTRSDWAYEGVFGWLWMNEWVLWVWAVRTLRGRWGQHGILALVFFFLSSAILMTPLGLPYLPLKWNPCLFYMFPSDVHWYHFLKQASAAG